MKTLPFSTIVFFLFPFSFGTPAKIAPLKISLKPGQVNEQTLKTGSNTPSVHNGSHFLALKYGLGYLYHEGEKIYLRKGDERWLVLNERSEIPSKMVNSEIAFVGKKDRNAWTITLEKLSLLSAPYSIPLFWCSSRKILANDNKIYSIFLGVFEKSIKRDIKTKTILENTAELDIWVFQHPDTVEGNARFHPQHLVFKGSYNANTKYFDFEGTIATSVTLKLPAGAVLQRVNRVWGFDFYLGTNFRLNVTREINNPQNDLYCIGTEGR